MKGNSHTIKKALQTVAVLTSKVGGDKRDRTADLLNAIQALSQLSYAPKTIKIIIENSLTCQYNCKI